MTNKRPKSVTLSPENHEYLSNHDNASALVDRLVTEVREGGDKATAVLQMQISQKREELTEAENKVERLENGVAELESLKTELSKQESSAWDEAREALDGVPLEPTNPAVKNWASKLGVPPQRIIERFKE